MLEMLGISVTPKMLYMAFYLLIPLVIAVVFEDSSKKERKLLLGLLALWTVCYFGFVDPSDVERYFKH